MTDSLDGEAYKEADRSTRILRRLRRLDNERSSEVAPAICGAGLVSIVSGAKKAGPVLTYKAKALATVRWV